MTTLLSFSISVLLTEDREVVLEEDFMSSSFMESSFMSSYLMSASFVETVSTLLTGVAVLCVAAVSSLCVVAISSLCDDGVVPADTEVI
jgi:hypothetical protein